MRKLGQREKSYIFVYKISSKQNKWNMRVHINLILIRLKIFSPHYRRNFFLNMTCTM